ncbi:MAG TPA: T9SS type A sorting domain-containing protein [Candidatus Marinimicrobia bacterium]|nr:T9SS type A sorting domain-containing protein [Candidatus Neomarinimicrobiota bacterium]
MICYLLLISASVLNADSVVFTKADSADWTLPENQDRITDNVWITRKHSQSLFNIAQEDGYSGNSGSPVGTLWSDTTTTAAGSASYTSFVAMHGGSPQSIIGDTVSLYLPQDGLYFDVTILSYSGGGNSGGGFSYSRTAVTTSVDIITDDGSVLPVAYALHQNYPNPFNPVTTLRYNLPENRLVNIIIYDMLGRRVKTLINQNQDAGHKSVTWDATNDFGKPVSAGIYLYQIQAGEYISTKKMVLLK